MLALKAAGEGILDMPVAGEAKLRNPPPNLAYPPRARPGKSWRWKLQTFFLRICQGRSGRAQDIKCFCNKERIEKWRELDILPIGAYYEVFEALHRTSTGTDGDWKNIMKQFLRCGWLLPGAAF